MMIVLVEQTNDVVLMINIKMQRKHKFQSEPIYFSLSSEIS